MSRDAKSSNRDGWLVALISISSRIEANTQTIIRMMGERTPPQPHQRSLISTAASIGIKVVIGRILAWVLYLGTPIMLWMITGLWHRIGPWWRYLLGSG